MAVALRPLTLPELAVAAGLPNQYHNNLHVLGEYVEQCGLMVTVRHWQAHFVHPSAKTPLYSPLCKDTSFQERSRDDRSQ